MKRQKITVKLCSILCAIFYQTAVGCNMSLKMHSHLDFFPENMGAVSDECGDNFYEDISQMEERYSGKRL
jgi:hypothetical protein